MIRYLSYLIALTPAHTALVAVAGALVLVRRRAPGRLPPVAQPLLEIRVGVDGVAHGATG
jgi:hypothetical protein